MINADMESSHDNNIKKAIKPKSAKPTKFIRSRTDLSTNQSFETEAANSKQKLSKAKDPFSESLKSSQTISKPELNPDPVSQGSKARPPIHVAFSQNPLSDANCHSPCG